MMVSDTHHPANLTLLMDNGAFPAQLIHLGQAFMGGISLSGSEHSVIKSSPRGFLEGKVINLSETVCHA